MGKFFKRKKKKPSLGLQSPKPRPHKVDAKDLVDPVLYDGGLDKEKYPQLPLENEKKEAKPEEEIENPLNKR